MNKAIGILGLLSSLALIGGALGACSSSSSTSSGGDDGGTKDGSTTNGKDAGPDDDSDDDDAGTDPGPTGDEACAAEATKQGCGQCCVTNHPAGYKTFSESLAACACQGTGADGGTAPCATECADTFCATPQKTPSAACDKCIQGSVGKDGACLAPVVSACQADPDCLDEQQCVAPCQSKP